MAKQGRTTRGAERNPEGKLMNNPNKNLDLIAHYHGLKARDIAETAIKDHIKAIRDEIGLPEFNALYRNSLECAVKRTTQEIRARISTAERDARTAILEGLGIPASWRGLQADGVVVTAIKYHMNDMHDAAQEKGYHEALEAVRCELNLPDVADNPKAIAEAVRTQSGGR